MRREGPRGGRPATNIIRNLVFLIMMLCGLAGCATVGMPDGQEAASIRTGAKAIVLMRITGTLDGKPLDPARLRAELANMDLGEAVKTPILPVRFLSTESRQEGWFYLLLGPGSYYLAPVPPGNDQNPPGSARDTYSGSWVVPQEKAYVPVSRFRFHVPENSPVVYIGSLSIECKGRWGVFGTLVRNCENFVLSDESDSAGAASDKLLSQFGPVSTRLMEEYGSSAWSAARCGMAWDAGRMSYAGYCPPQNITGPLHTTVWRPAASAPVTVETSDPPDLQVPAWRSRALGRTTGIGGDSAPGRIGSPPLTGMDPNFGAGAAMAYLLYLPFGLVGGALAGSYSEQTWGPCMNELTAEVKKIGPSELLSAAIVDRLQKAGIDASSTQKGGHEPGEHQTPGSSIMADITRIALRECDQRWTFCLEMATRIRVKDASTGNYLYDATFLYTSPLARTPAIDRPYELKLPTASSCTGIETVCGTGKLSRLREEISRAVEVSVGHALDSVRQEQQ